MDKVEELHHDFTLANLLDGKVTESKWNYRNLVLGGSDSDFYTVEDGIAFYESNVRGNMPPTRKNVRRNAATEAWGAYYRAFTGSEPGYAMTFTGPAQVGVLPATGTWEWYGGLGNMLDRRLTRSVSGVPAGAVLSFMTWYDIETDWDYGHVEASRDGGVTWQQLPQLSTLPAGVTNINGSSAWVAPGGFTGVSGGWKQARYDLTDYAGTVMLRFRYLTDEASNGQGWYVDDIKVTSGATTVFDDPVDTDTGWSIDVVNGWVFTSGLQDNDWTADAYIPMAKGQARAYAVNSVLAVGGTGTSGTASMPAQYLKSGKTYGIVSNRPRNGVMAATGKLTVLKGK